ncbi:Glycoside hydrolase [Parasponia andersonii]|uniref:Beta-galactosidase n=1 Tax=Parasponia andersonii TaxID=3476 RepID=A0A2P5CTX8_PARAD|nr:Glycoside hydrolase [Parasponia andersonii]
MASLGSTSTRNHEILILIAMSLAPLLTLCSEAAPATTDNNVSYDAKSFIINGERRLIFSGSIHYPRSTEQMWPDLIQKAKEGGLDAIETYIFWDRHEPVRRHYDFSGNLDFVKFFKTIQEAGLYGVLRIGPYVCAEWSYGGFPLWLKNMPGIQLRTNNEIYKNEMQTFVTKIVNMCKEAKLFASQGGPIIIAQIENEYGNIMGPYGEAGKAYINWCAQMAVSQNTGVPWIMCQQNDAPEPMINTCNGYYCDWFTPNNPNSPKMFTENWVGWFKKWGERDPHRTAEDVAYSVARFFQRGGVFNNYYMYHGGTNFGRTAGGPYIATSYDYDAPLDEYGNLNQPKWGHLKRLHEAIKVGEKILTTGNWTGKEIFPGVNLTTYTDVVTGQRFCFLSNTNNSGDPITVDLQNDGVYWLPAWSVSILDGCNKEIYNTAKVNSQTSLYVKKQSSQHLNHNSHKGNDKLTWLWAPEDIKDTLRGKGRFRASQLLDQKLTTSDVSDYLWYMTTVAVNKTQSLTLSVKAAGHVLHVYVNKKYVGSHLGTAGQLGFTFESPVVLSRGENTITLLSATVGLPNYGAFYDSGPTGIVGGPVLLIRNDNSTPNDLSFNQWSYKVGLNGEAKRFFDPTSSRAPWRTSKSNELPTGRRMTWYKASFQTPSGDEPVVVDLLGMGKGHAWVNGHSLGRIWPSVLADSNGCGGDCDYRGDYNPGKCPTNCGNSSQRSYHVPRAFLNVGKTNTLILFEELGGNPQGVSFQTVSVETVCGNAYEGSMLELSCHGGKTISGIDFASFGNPVGKCGSFSKGSCESKVSISEVEKACVGKEACAIVVSDGTFGSTSCGNVTKRLAVQASCEN